MTTAAPQAKGIASRQSPSGFHPLHGKLRGDTITERWRCGSRRALSYLLFYSWRTSQGSLVSFHLIPLTAAHVLSYPDALLAIIIFLCSSTHRYDYNFLFGCSMDEYVDLPILLSPITSFSRPSLGQNFQILPLLETWQNEQFQEAGWMA